MSLQSLIQEVPGGLSRYRPTLWHVSLVPSVLICPAGWILTGWSFWVGRLKIKVIILAK